MHTKPLIGLLAIAAVGVAACGSSGSNDAGMMPTTVYGKPFMVRRWPTTAGFAWSRVRQRRSLMTTT